jgi:hypothetical protein
VLAALGAWQMPALMSLFGNSASAPQVEVVRSYPLAGSTLACVYVLGMILIWFAPETKGRPLPE